MSYEIVPFRAEHAASAAALFNRCAARGETLYRPISEADYAARFVRDGALAFAALDKGTLIGWIHGAVKTTYLNGETFENTPAYLTALYVDEARRGRGVGTALLAVLRAAYASLGKCAMICSGDNPVHLSWLIPGTPDHDHNNAPGVDESCGGYAFLLKHGFEDRFHEVAMYISLKDYIWPEELDEKRRVLAEASIGVGRWQPGLGDEFDGMCDRVGSEYWRNVLRHELDAWHENRPNDDPELWPDGRQPAGPRTLLTATHNGHIVGFTGPVDKQQSGRGWFTGICTDPQYGGKGIASLLFNLLMREFIEEGAAFTSLFTGVTNHAQKIYLRAGLRPVARFAVLSAQLAPGKEDPHRYF